MFIECDCEKCKHELMRSRRMSDYFSGDSEKECLIEAQLKGWHVSEVAEKAIYALDH
jgi:hypothetical protein